VLCANHNSKSCGPLRGCPFGLKMGRGRSSPSHQSWRGSTRLQV
jgi:hypothetical protein